jgi:hypothetical protein
MPSFAKRVFDGLADLQRGARRAGGGADRQGAIVDVARLPNKGREQTEFAARFKAISTGHALINSGDQIG